MGGGTYIKQTRQASCVQNIQSKGRKAPLLLIPHHLRLVAYNSNCIFIVFLSLIMKMTLDVRSRVYCLLILKL